MTGKLARALIGLSVLSLSTGGCYTVFNHPARATLGVVATDAGAAELGYYPYSPTVWGWYYGHYGDYWSYYAHPWWMSHHHSGDYYPGEDGFSPDPRATGFGRGGRGSSTDGRPDESGFANPNTYVAPPVADPPPRPGSGTVTTSQGTAGTEKPKEEKKEEANVGGRGGRK